MLVINHSSTFREDPIFKFNFEKFSNDKASENIVLHLDSPKDKKTFNDGRKHYLLDLELPNRFFNPKTRELAFLNEQRFDKILSIDPLSSKLRNDKLGYDLYEGVFFPYPYEFINNEMGVKDYDICYVGHNAPNILNIVDRKYKIYTSDRGRHKLPTYSSKLNLINKSKSSLVHNIFWLDGTVIKWLNQFDSNNFIVVKNNKTVQYKSRVLDSVFNKSLLLVMKDDFNIIENLFTENEHFIYVDESNINDVLDDINKNFDYYKNIINNTFEFAKDKYTVSKFYEKYIKNE